MVFITGRQLIAARGLLGWTRDDLGQKAGVSPFTVTRMESFEDGIIKGRIDTLQAILAVLAEAKIKFTENGGVDFEKE